MINTKLYVLLKIRVDLLAELSRREKTSNIKPDADLDVYMKVIYYIFYNNTKK